jgi:hypothetical protein
MNSVRLPEGGKAWFVRRRRGRHCGLRVASIEGRLLTAAYAAFVTGAAWLLIGEDANTVRVVAFVVLILVATFLYILTAWRMSASAPNTGNGRCS